LSIRPDNGSGCDADVCCLPTDEGEFFSLDLENDHILKEISNAHLFFSLYDWCY
jgi:hypothetical protein